MAVAASLVDDSRASSSSQSSRKMSYVETAVISCVG